MPDTSTGSAVVIEDDEDIRMLISTVLGERGLEVRCAASGLAGLALVEQHQPDLVTLDLGLPDIEGLEVCRRLRAVSDAYVVMVSASSEEVDQLLALEIGADDYITKPFSPRRPQGAGGGHAAPSTALARSAAGVGDQASVPPTADPVTEPTAPGGVAPADAARASADEAACSSQRLSVDLEGREVVLDGRSWR